MVLHGIMTVGYIVAATNLGESKDDMMRAKRNLIEDLRDTQEIKEDETMQEAVKKGYKEQMSGNSNTKTFLSEDIVNKMKQKGAFAKMNLSKISKIEGIDENEERV